LAHACWHPSFKTGHQPTYLHGPENGSPPGPASAESLEEAPGHLGYAEAGTPIRGRRGFDAAGQGRHFLGQLGLQHPGGPRPNVANRRREITEKSQPAPTFRQPARGPGPECVQDAFSAICEPRWDGKWAPGRWAQRGIPLTACTGEWCSRASATRWAAGGPRRTKRAGVRVFEITKADRGGAGGLICSLRPGGLAGGIARPQRRCWGETSSAGGQEPGLDGTRAAPETGFHLRPGWPGHCRWGAAFTRLPRLRPTWDDPDPRACWPRWPRALRPARTLFDRERSARASRGREAPSMVRHPTNRGRDAALGPADQSGDLEALSWWRAVGQRFTCRGSGGGKRRTDAHGPQGMRPGRQWHSGASSSSTGETGLPVHRCERTPGGLQPGTRMWAGTPDAAATCCTPRTGCEVIPSRSRAGNPDRGQFFQGHRGHDGGP